jgi:hypothetical protein
MKYIITEGQFEDSVIHYLNEMYGDLEEYMTSEYPNSIFFVKGKKVYMEQTLESGFLWISYNTIWSDLKFGFGLGRNEIKPIITKWVKKTYKIKGYIPECEENDDNGFWKELLS